MAFLLKDDLLALQASLPPQTTLEEIGVRVSETLERTKDAIPDSSRKLFWEACLRDDILNLAATEGSALDGDQAQYYELMRAKLDLILILTEREACDPPFPINIIEDLMETQTIESCSKVFSWMEDRSDRLTRGMEPQKGKALVLLRTLNELLRRLSKTAQTTFCGRILTFLSGAYSLGDRSGVNLRGEYGPLWEEVRIHAATTAAMEVDLPPQGPTDPSNVPGIEIDEATPEKRELDGSQSSRSDVTKETSDAKREEFFETFWSLQRFFSRPPNLALPGAFDKFKAAVNSVLPVISEANKKERLLMGSKAKIGSAGAKRKREPLVETPADDRHDYFFAKFLTSPDLLELELADAVFRRQILMQLMITLQYLHMLTKTEKTKWHPPKNRSLLTEFALESHETAWVMETWSKTMTEIKATTPLGKEFAEAVSGVLQRERNWVGWKNEHCPSFDKPSIQTISDGRLITESERLWPRQAWQWTYGTEELTELFEMGYRGMEDLQNPNKPDDLPTLVKRIKAIDKRIEMRKKQLAIQNKRKIALQSAAAPQDQSSSSSNENTTAVAAVLPAPAPLMIRQSSGSIASNVQKTHPAMHPLPPKPGTAGPTPAKQPIGPPVTEKIEAQRTKKVAPPLVPRDPQLEGFEEEKRKLSWLALRSAREDYWQLFAAAKGNPEKMMWMVERNKEVMKKWDEDSFAVTGWVEGDKSTPYSEEKPKGAVTKQPEVNPNMTTPQDDTIPPGLDFPIEVDSNRVGPDQDRVDGTIVAQPPAQENGNV